MIGDRFTVGSVTGYCHIAQRRPATVWSVHDSAYGYRVIREHRGQNAERRARAFADLMNGHVQPPMPWDSPLHGTMIGYTHRGCRCQACYHAPGELREARRLEKAAA